MHKIILKSQFHCRSYNHVDVGASHSCKGLNILQKVGQHWLRIDDFRLPLAYAPGMPRQCLYPAMHAHFFSAALPYHLNLEVLTNTLTGGMLHCSPGASQHLPHCVVKCFQCRFNSFWISEFPQMYGTEIKIKRFQISLQTSL